MAVPPGPEERRRRQRRRAVIGWAGLILVVLFVAATIVLGSSEGDDDGRGQVQVPYGEQMTSSEYEEIEEGEDQAEVLGRLDASGRPEDLTEDYVLTLFGPLPEDAVCSYWEFSDEPQYFVRLCFDREDGELIEKDVQDIHDGFESGGTIAGPRGAAGYG